MNRITIAHMLPVYTIILGCGLAGNITKPKPNEVRAPGPPASIQFLNQPDGFNGALLCTEEGKDFKTIDIKVLDANSLPCPHAHLRFSLTFGLLIKDSGSDFVETDENGIAHINIVADKVAQGSYTRSGTLTIRSGELPQAEASAGLVYTKTLFLMADSQTYHSAYDSTELINNQCDPSELSSMFFGIWQPKIKAFGPCGLPYPNLKLGHSFNSQASLYPSDTCSQPIAPPLGLYTNDTFSTDQDGIAYLTLKRATQYNVKNCDGTETISYLQYEDFVAGAEIETNALTFVTRNPICD